MKKIPLLFMLMVMLVSMLLPAQAASTPLSISFIGPVTLMEGESAPVLKTIVNSTKSGIIRYTLTDAVSGQIIFSQTRENVQSGALLSWPASYNDLGLSAKTPVKRITAAFEMDEKTYTYTFYYNYSVKNEKAQIAVEKATWYSNNTACSFGPQFRVLRPELTDKWYMFTPIDLTRQGRQIFEYVASNLYVIGKVLVDVDGDQVTVNYFNYYVSSGGNTETTQEFFTFLPDLSGVSNVDPETMPHPGFAFGQPLSIEKDLQGDTNVLLFIRNKVTYCDYVTHSVKLTRFWINHPDRVALRNEMMALMD